MEFIFDYGLFLAKIFTVVVAILVVVGGIAAMRFKGKDKLPGHIEIRHLNEKIDSMRDAIKEVVLDKLDLKQALKEEKAQAKAEAKAKKEAAKAQKSGKKDAQTESSEAHPEGQDKKRVYVLNFNGDIRASAVSSLREEITAVLSLVGKQDEIVICLESPGGMVHAYGLAASQLQRIRDKDIQLTVCVDKVAASGGYMMACLGNKIIAAPFAVLGSIGVMAQLPNFHRLLKKHDIDFELLTAGEYKRTLTVLGENTEKARKKFIQDLEDTHVLFKDFVSEHRPSVDIEKVATGEIWFGKRALDCALIDEIKTSDEYLMDACNDATVYEIKYVEKKSLQEKLGVSMQNAMEKVMTRFWDRLFERNYF